MPSMKRFRSSTKRNPQGGLMLTYIPGGTGSMKAVSQMNWDGTAYGYRSRYIRMYGIAPPEPREKAPNA